MHLMIGVYLSETQWIQWIQRVQRVQVFRVFESLCKALPAKSLRLHCAVGTKDQTRWVWTHGGVSINGGIQKWLISNGTI